MLAGLSALTALDIGKLPPIYSGCGGSLPDEELHHIAKLTSLRYLNLAGKLKLEESVAIQLIYPRLVHALRCLTSLAFLNITFVNGFLLRDGASIASRRHWKVLTVLECLPLQELHIGFEPMQPLFPQAWDPCELYKGVQGGLEGAPKRLTMALLRGSRGWPSHTEAQRLLCPARERQDYFRGGRGWTS